MNDKLEEFIITEKDFDPRDNISACVYGPPIKYFFKCENCGHEWISKMTARRICPNCGKKCKEYKIDD